MRIVSRDHGTKTGAKKTTAKKKAVAEAKKAAPAKAKVAKKTTARVAKVTLGSLSEQVAAVAVQIAKIFETLASILTGTSTKEVLATAAVVKPVAPFDYESFETDVLANDGVERPSGRHGGLVPIPELLEHLRTPLQ